MSEGQPPLPGGDPGSAPAPAPPRAYQGLLSPADRPRRFKAIRDEARERGLDLADPEAFGRAAETRSVLRQVAGGDDHPELHQQLGALVFQAWHFHRSGEAVAELDVEACRELVSRPAEADWTVAPMDGAGYVRLPADLFRAAAPPGEAAPWLEGFFWTQAGGQLILLPVLEGGGQGMSLLPLPPLPFAAGALWAGQTVRQGEADFTRTGSGGDAEGYAIAAAAEIVKLAARALWRLAPRPLEPEPEDAEEADPAGADMAWAGEEGPSADPDESGADADDPRSGQRSTAPGEAADSASGTDDPDPPPGPESQEPGAP